MDNAVRALVIAGGILIAVLVISICMYAYTSFRETYENVMLQHDALQIEQFNSFFNKYGSSIKGWEAYNIVNKIRDINADPESLTIVNLTGSVTESTVKQVFYFTENFDNTYNYSYSDTNGDGLYDSINIS